MKEKEIYPGEEQNSLDNLFRNSLKGYEAEPPARVWQNIRRKMLYREMLRLNFTNIPRGIIYGAIAGVSLIIAMIFFYNTAEDKPVPIPETAGLSQPTKTIGQPAESPVLTKTITQPAVSSEKAVIPAAGNLTKMALPGITQPGKGNLITTETNTPVKAQIITPALISSTTEENSFFVKISSLNKQDLWIGQHPGTIQPIPAFATQQAIPQFFSGSFGITPEYTSLKNSKSQTSSDMTYWARLGLTYHYSRFSVSTGLAYGYSTTEAKYRVNYRSNDSIGFFTSVVSFYVNPADPSEIIFNTKTLAVYDSIDHLTDDRARSRYTYLTIPLLAGFDILQTSRLTVTLQAGPSFTFLIGRKEAEPYIDYPGARIIRIDSERPVKVKTSWKVLSALHFDYRLTKGFSLYAEPTFSYYLKTAYENNELPEQNPWSIGIGLGVKYNFGKGLPKQSK